MDTKNNNIKKNEKNKENEYLKINDWVLEYKKYNGLLKELVEKINVYRIYVNSKREIISIENDELNLSKNLKKIINPKDNNIINENDNENIKNENDIIQSNELKYESYLSKEQLIYYIAKHMKYNSIRYKVLSIIKLNFDINEDELDDFLELQNNKLTIIEENEFLNNPIKEFLKFENGINDLKFNDTCVCLQELNELFIVYYEEQNNEKKYINKREKMNKNQTKKISLKIKKLDKNKKHKYTRKT